MRLAYVTMYDPLDVNGAWSGIGYFMLRALRKAGIEVDPIGPLALPLRPSVFARRVYHRFVARETYLWPMTEPMARGMAADVTRALAGGRFDVVFAPDRVPVAYLEGDWPLVTWTDATFANLLDHYPGYARAELAEGSVRDGLTIEARAIQRASTSVYASEWAAASAVEDFGADPRRVHVIPLGANLEDPPSSAEIEDALDRRPTDRCSLVFVGVDWERKGGSTALEVTEALNRSGLPAHLTVVGGTPHIPDRFAGCVTVRGHLDRNARGKEELAGLLRRSHFLVLPTRVEAYGLVLCEANAFGVPALTTAVDGVPTVVSPGVNGMLFAPDAPPEEYAAYVRGLFDDYERYLRLARASRAEYETRLNWDVAGETVKAVLERL